MSNISDDFSYGKNFNIGNFCVIEPDVIVGDNVTLGHNVVLKSGTRFGNNVIFDDYCCTTGMCYLGNDVTVRTRSTISKGVIVEDKTFIGGGVMTSHTKHVYHCRPNLSKKQYITRIGVGVIIGSSTNVRAGITIANNVIVGYASNVIKNLLFEGRIYFGNPAKELLRIRGLGKTIPAKKLVEIPANYQVHQFPKEMLEKYLPYFIVGDQNG